MKNLDNLELLNEMLIDQHKAEMLYQPTRYWALFIPKIIQELRIKGLNGFRDRSPSMLDKIGANDRELLDFLAMKTSILGARRFMPWIIPFIKKWFEISLSPLEYFYSVTKDKFEAAGLKLPGMSLVGCRNARAKFDDKYFSTWHLNYCKIFIDAYSCIKFEDSSVFVELGAGCGRQVEVIAKIFPRMTFLIFDIPPTLYAINQYLSHVFPGRVVEYNEAIKLNNLSSCQGKIIISPNWKLPEWRNVKINIFWNAASFQEMEPVVVRNYLDIVKTMNPEWIYLHEIPGGNFHGATGTVKPVTIDLYHECLDEKYVLNRDYRTDYFLFATQGKFVYHSWIFNKKQR
jgi:putative sugar O-methyltransferase